MPDFAERVAPAVGELWQDAKGKRFRIVGLATSHEGLAPVVVYKAAGHGAVALWACPLDEFLSCFNNGDHAFSRLTADAERHLKTRLQELLPEKAVEWVLECYDQPWRVYHDRAHVVHAFSFAQRERWTLSDAQALALLFHDAVYIPGALAGDNERASVLLMKLVCRYARVEACLVERACSIILDTIEHLPSSEEARLVLDLDLSVFVLAGQGLANPSSQVWLEVRPLLPDDDAAALRTFWSARGTILAAFAERARIYTSPEFAGNQALEQCARRHLSAELERLKECPIP